MPASIGSTLPSDGVTWLKQFRQYDVDRDMRLHNATATFPDLDHAEDAKTYLLAQEFNEADIVIEQQISGALLTVHSDTIIEMREAVDVLRNYGGTDIRVSE